jgi:hypothetical protein
MALGLRAALLAGEVNSVPKRILVPSGVVLLLLLGLNLWLWPNQTLQHSPTSFGAMRDGYKAAFDLLSEMHFPVTRSFLRPKLTPTNQTVWFIAPSFLEADKPSAHDDAREVVEWAARGGTAVIFGEWGSDWKALGLTREVEKGQDKDDRSLIRGDLEPIPRWLDTPELLHFTALNGKDAGAHAHERVLLTADGKPFALEMAVGKQGGRLIAIADGNFLRNQDLAEADASLLLVDLVRAYGTPVFDEHSHGLAAPASLTLAVLDSRAILPLIIGLLVAMLWIFSQRVWPRRSLEEDSELPAPSIASFVESLAILYSRAGDPAAVFRAYRAGFLRRLRRQVGLRTDSPEDLLLERIARDRSLPAETRHWLLESDAPADHRHLVIAVRALEFYPKLRSAGTFGT